MLGAASLTATDANVDSEPHLATLASESTQAVAGPALLAPQMEAANRAAGTAKVATGHVLSAKVILCPWKSVKAIDLQL